MGARRLACLIAVWWLAVLSAATAAAQEGDSRFTTSVTARSLGFAGMREPLSFTPSAAFTAQHPGWTRDWSERRLYASLAYRLVDADAVALSPGFHVGVAVGRFEARNRGLGYYEAWDTRPAFLWGPSCELLLRRQRAGGLFARLRYELFLAAAPEGAEEVRTASGTATPPSARDAVFSWTSHEATVSVGYDLGKASFDAGVALTAFRLDKRLSHHIDPAGATGNALAAILALDTQTSRYGYEPQSLVSPYLSATFRPLAGCSLGASLRLSSRPDIALRLAVSF
ncbi:hypothetical protein [Solidesulfovibrio alcoholivorans]|uniref:hypothetical protein n=1 Tax=Solidesulfovibrio alcoholivorans TaxID=81406 RepID=UPI000694419A|nr:hypothetical protein [Solidesulfovibrio alcoholivorans]